MQKVNKIEKTHIQNNNKEQDFSLLKKGKHQKIVKNNIKTNNKQKRNMKHSTNTMLGCRKQKNKQARKIWDEGQQIKKFKNSEQNATTITENT
jgi:hypothetical protein